MQFHDFFQKYLSPKNSWNWNVIFLTIFYTHCSFFEHQVSSWYWVKRRKSADVIITYPICTTKQSLVHLHIEKVKQLKLQLKVENFLIKKQKFFFEKMRPQKTFCFSTFFVLSWSHILKHYVSKSRIFGKKIQFFFKRKILFKNQFEF